MMKKKTFQDKTAYLIQRLTELVQERMEDTGDTCETSQKICVITAVNNLEATINGVEQRDLK